MTSRKKKGIIGGVTIFLAATLLIGGTLTWTDFTQSRINRFRGSVYYDATLHDDFDGENKDVYVENSGENTIYVRIRLDEYMQIGNINMYGQDVTKKGEDDTIVTSLDKEQWLTHKYAQTTSDNAHLNCGKADETDVKENAVGNAIQFHKYYQWTMSGEQIWYDPGTPGVVSSVLDGIKKDADGNQVTDAYGTPIPIVDASKETGGTKPTLDAATPITMKEYIDLAKIAAIIAANGPASMDETQEALWAGVEKGCWILDSDGWAYWSQPLEPGEATNLLLDKVELVSKEPTDDWYYAIDVKLQAVSLNETKTTWKTSGTYTDEALTLIESWNAE